MAAGLAAAWTLGVAAAGARACEAAGAGETVTIASVEPGNLVRLADGRDVRLKGVDLDSLRLPSLAGQEATLVGAGPPDRHGAIHADLIVDGTFLASQLAGAGHARIRPAPGDAPCEGYGDLLKAEASARQGGLGLWAEPMYEVLDASEPAAVSRHEDAFVIVSGKVAHVGTSGRTLWIDFGRIWRTDVTLAVPAKERDRFAAAGVAPATLLGRRIRARGIVTLRDGPRIDIAEPAAIERVDGP